MAYRAAADLATDCRFTDHSLQHANGPITSRMHCISGISSGPEAPLRCQDAPPDTMRMRAARRRGCRPEPAPIHSRPAAHPGRDRVARSKDPSKLATFPSGSASDDPGGSIDRIPRFRQSARRLGRDLRTAGRVVRRATRPTPRSLAAVRNPARTDRHAASPPRTPGSVPGLRRSDRRLAPGMPRLRDLDRWVRRREPSRPSDHPWCSGRHEAGFGGPGARSGRGDRIGGTGAGQRVARSRAHPVARWPGPPAAETGPACDGVARRLHGRSRGSGPGRAA